MEHLGNSVGQTYKSITGTRIESHTIQKNHGSTVVIIYSFQRPTVHAVQALLPSSWRNSFQKIVSREIVGVPPMSRGELLAKL